MCVRLVRARKLLLWKDGTYTVSYSIPDWAQGPVKLEVGRNVASFFEVLLAHSEGAAGWSSYKRLSTGATTHRPEQ